jgi:hypothetical protein
MDSSTGRPERSSCWIKAVARLLGTGLPLTMAKFWAEAQVLTDNNTAALSKDKTGFMGILEKNKVREVLKGVSGVCGGQDFDGQGVQTRVGKWPQRIIHKAVLGHAAQTRETGRSHAHPKVRATDRALRAGVAGVIGALIDHPEFGG